MGLRVGSASWSSDDAVGLGTLWDLSQWGQAQQHAATLFRECEVTDGLDVLFDQLAIRVASITAAMVSLAPCVANQHEADRPCSAPGPASSAPAAWFWAWSAMCSEIRIARLLDGARSRSFCSRGGDERGTFCTSGASIRQCPGCSDAHEVPLLRQIARVRDPGKQLRDAEECRLAALLRSEGCSESTVSWCIRQSRSMHQSGAI